MISMHISNSCAHKCFVIDVLAEEYFEYAIILKIDDTIE